MNPEIYDELKAVADQYGGVGHSRIGDTRPAKLVNPCCIWGMTHLLPFDRAVLASTELLASGVTPLRQDYVFTPTERADRNYRLPFEEWARRLGVTRG